jgi:hypothetical protein
MFSEMLRCQQCGGQVVFDDGGAANEVFRRGQRMSSKG